jgi:hypothetical protein
MILAENICLDKDLPKTKENGVDHVKNFLDNVPFENIISGTFTYGQSTKVIAANEDLCRSIAFAFEQKGFQVADIVPAFVMSQYGADFRSGFTQEAARAAIKNAASLRQFTLSPKIDLTKQNNNS